MNDTKDILDEEQDRTEAFLLRRPNSNVRVNNEINNESNLN